MAVFKCKMCGGDLEIQEGLTICECEYCGTKQTIPALDDEKKISLFARANKLRFACEFDKAAGVYESIVEDFPDEAEGYWGLILCKYGIEYVDDPATNKKIPTCHRSSFDSLIDDSDFEMVLENSDPISRKLYREEAKAIEELRKSIVQVSSAEDPYDIFICYKETDENGDRTIDSEIAQDVYTALTEKGYRVFFARITLEDRLGKEYEPYIFAALNSAKVMLAFGTDYEYYNAVWVKNEWSRFLKLIAKGEKKTLIPCYKNIDAYDMPKEFAKLQAQDMGKVGAIQDLVRGIEKLLGKNQPAPMKDSVVVNSGSNFDVVPLLKRAFMFLEDRDFKSADEYCEKVLDIDPENARAYVGKLMVDYGLKKQADLKNLPNPFNENNNFQKALRFADENLKTELIGYLNFIATRNENARLESIYNDAQELVAKGNENSFKQAAEMFESIGLFRDSAELANVCFEKAEACRKERERLAEEKRKADVARKKRNKRLAVFFSSVICVIIAFIIVLNTVIIPNNKYNDAVALLEAGKYAEAVSVFEALDDYKDSVEKIVECKYNYAVSLLEAGKYAEAISAFEALDGYKDSATKITECNTAILDGQYNNAVALLESGNIVEAYEAFIELEGYKDSIDIANSIHAKYKKEKFKNAHVGNYIFFGSYEQDNNFSNGKEAIEWLVLDKQDNKVLVISKHALDCKQFHTSLSYVTWETCSLRTWLNNDFLNDAFSKNELDYIPTMTVPAHENPDSWKTTWWTIDSGNTTKDKIFLLSTTEAYKFFDSDNERMCKPTEYAETKGAYTESAESGTIWYLRSPGSIQNEAAGVEVDGNVDDYISINGYCSKVTTCQAIRPAMWIEID